MESSLSSPKDAHRTGCSNCTTEVVSKYFFVQCFSFIILCKVDNYWQHCAKRRYLSYSEANFEVFRPAGVTHCTDEGKIWRGGGGPLHAKFHPHRCNGKSIGPPKLKFLLRFDQNVEYKCLAGAYPSRDFHKICKVCTPFQDTLAVKILSDLLKGLWSYGGFKLMGSGCPEIFSAP